MTHCSSTTPVSLVILAAGQGRRFGGNKPLATIADSDKPLMYFSVQDAYRAGIRRLVLVLSQAMEGTIREQFLPLLPADLDVALVQQKADDLPAGCRPQPREKPWGTGHALWCARKAIPGDCIVINADDYYGPAAMSIMREHLAAKATWAMLSFSLDKTLSDSGTVNRGICKQENEFLVAVDECLSIKRAGSLIHGQLKSDQLQLAPETPVSMNIWGFGSDIFTCLERGLSDFFFGLTENTQAEFYLPQQVMRSIQHGENRVRVYTSPDQWRGVTYRQDLERLIVIQSPDGKATLGDAVVTKN
jgi:choline kinase